jgi:hypothetical protein
MFFAATLGANHSVLLSLSLKMLNAGIFIGKTLAEI